MEAEKVMRFVENELAKEFSNNHFVKWVGNNESDIRIFVLPSGYLREDVEVNEETKEITFHQHDSLTVPGVTYVVPDGSWFVRTPDGKIYPVGRGVRTTTKTPVNLDGVEPDDACGYNIPITFHYPDPAYDIYETEVVENGNGTSLRYKRDENGNLVLKKKSREETGHPESNTWKDRLSGFTKK